jgi:hypothetical protein
MKEQHNKKDIKRKYERAERAATDEHSNNAHKEIRPLPYGVGWYYCAWPFVCLLFVGVAVINE